MVKVITFGCRINSFEAEILKEKFKDVDNLIKKLDYYESVLKEPI